jgi:hypothetical protein
VDEDKHRREAKVVSTQSAEHQRVRREATEALKKSAALREAVRQVVEHWEGKKAR